MFRPEFRSGAGHCSESFLRDGGFGRQGVIRITPSLNIDLQKARTMITTNEQQTMLTPLLTVREAADVLRVSERTLWSLTNSKELPSVRVGRSVRYDQNDLASWIASRKTVS
ncbi:MAG: excisionase family DNA binding protein [Planctomycetaceae bacterium]|jgi:excisionase family DNA binding protein